MIAAKYRDTIRAKDQVSCLIQPETLLWVGVPFRKAIVYRCAEVGWTHGQATYLYEKWRETKWIFMR
jgi:hypothetical protein